MTDDDAAAAAAYYDDPAVATFYRELWGGDDIHIGRYDRGDETVADASVAMTDHLLDLAGVGPGDRVLDIACGYGGTLRALAARGCRPAGIDISEVCVTAARRANEAAGLADRIAVAPGDFHAIDSPDGAFDAAVCQESLIHSRDKPRVFAEVRRILRPGGVFALSDILTAEGADPARVQPAFDRLGVLAGATPAGYRRMARDAGFVIRHAEERPHDIRAHYDRLADLLARGDAGLAPAAADRIAASLARWQAAIADGQITWACLVARAPEAG
jgi:cyclopropane fatty-acyl-phospholipid synthase-like methyltransferase